MASLPSSNNPADRSDGDFNPTFTKSSQIQPEILDFLEGADIPYLNNLQKIWPILRLVYDEGEGEINTEFSVAEDLVAVFGAIETEVGTNNLGSFCLRLAGRNVGDRVTRDKGFNAADLKAEAMETSIGYALVTESDPQVIAYINGLDELSWFVLKRMYEQIIGKTITFSDRIPEFIKKVLRIVKADIESDKDFAGNNHVSVGSYPLWIALAQYQRRFVADPKRWGSYKSRYYELTEWQLLAMLIERGAKGITGIEFEEAGKEASLMGKALHRFLAMVWDGKIYGHPMFTDLKDSLRVLYPISYQTSDKDKKELFDKFRLKVLNAAQALRSGRYMSEMTDPEVMKLIIACNDILGLSLDISIDDPGALERLINMLAIIGVEIADPLIDYHKATILMEITVDEGRVDIMVLPARFNGRSEAIALLSPVKPGAEQSYPDIADVLKALKHARRDVPIVIVEIKTSLNQRGDRRGARESHLVSLKGGARSLKLAGVDLSRVTFLLVDYTRTSRTVTPITQEQLIG